MTAYKSSVMCQEGTPFEKCEGDLRKQDLETIKNNFYACFIHILYLILLTFLWICLLQKWIVIVHLNG